MAHRPTQCLDCFSCRYHSQLDLRHLGLPTIRIPIHPCLQRLPILHLILGERIGGKKVYTEGVFSSENLSAPTGKKQVWCIGLVYTKKPVFKGKRRKIHIHQRDFKVFAGDLFAQHWCIDFGLLREVNP